MRPLLLALFLPFAATARADITAAHFANAAHYSATHGGLAVRVERGGKVLFESYAPGFSASTPHKIYSGTKSFFAVAALVAEKEGLLSLAEKASDTLPEWRNDGRRNITIEELLSQTSGLDPDLAYLYPYRDQLAAALRVPLIDTPGARFHYGGVNYQAFGEILKRKLRAHDESLQDFMEDKIFDPLDIDVAAWTHDDAGNPLIHSGLSLSAEEWAKFGNFVNRTREGGGSRVVNAQLLGDLFIAPGPNPAYGLGFWLNRPPPEPQLQPIKVLELAIDGEQLYPGGPRDLIAAIGSGHQMLYMIPSQDIVIVRFAYDEPFSDGDFLSRLLTGRPHPDAQTHDGE
ncbi:MAG TPA: serine hydrolase domain-containing protein [Candidatus Methylacidiphilales bacterium]|jgi:CubicO group peptidase (beta-lactamase class C family)|nr:serine hydrolase domain-containing protein [Candidatus Methylacidiphilales bacterium]